jgi:CubicO group peptidase (beta-lactamase class C family)
MQVRAAFRLHAAIAVVPILACAGPEAPAPGPTPETIAQGLLPAVQLEGEAPVTFTLEDRLAHYHVPGVSVAVMDGGDIVWARGWGIADEETGAAVTENTLFQAASISKPVAALAALGLVEDGLLSLDGPVNGVLTSWRVPDNEFTADSAVTLRGVLTHSAGLTVWGFPGYRKDEPFSADREVATNADVLDGLGNTDEVRVYKVPGTSWQYSGGGYTVMEQMVEDVTGRPFDEVLRSRVLVPAGMERSTYEVPLSRDRWPEAARGYRGDGSEVEGEWHSYPEQAAAGLWTTPTDLLTLSRHLLGILDGDVTDGVLSREMLTAMLTPNHPGDEKFSNWGLGFGLQGEGERARFGHGGANEGFRSQWTVYRHAGKGIAVMTNGDAGSPLATEIMRSVAAAYGWPGADFVPEVRARRTLSADVLAGYEGTFGMEERPDFAVTVAVTGDGGALTVDVPGQGTSVIHASADTDDEFFDTDDGSVLSFQRDEAGVIVAVQPRNGPRLVRRDPR